MADADRSVEVRVRLVVLGAIVCGATWLRIYNLAALGFWRDEGASVMVAASLGRGHWSTDIHPPLYYALLRAWSAFGSSDSWLRLLSVFLGVMTIPLVYAIGARMFGSRAGLWSAAALALLPIHIRYSQEARMYALLTLLFAGALWGVGVIATTSSGIGWVAYVCCTALMCYTHAIGVVYWPVLAFVLGFVLYRGRGATRPTVTLFVAVNGLVALLFLPWVEVLLAKTQVLVRHYWIAAPRLQDIYRIPFVSFAIGEVPSLERLLGPSLGKLARGRAEQCVAALPHADARRNWVRDSAPEPSMDPGNHRHRAWSSDSRAVRFQHRGQAGADRKGRASDGRCRWCCCGALP